MDINSASPNALDEFFKSLQFGNFDFNAASNPKDFFGGSNFSNNSAFSGNSTNPLDGINRKGLSTFGKGIAGLQALAGLAEAIGGFKQLKLGRKQLDQNKQAFNSNFTNQAKITNFQLRDLANKRARSNAAIRNDPQAIQDSIDAFLATNGVNERGIR